VRPVTLLGAIQDKHGAIIASADSLVVSEDGRTYSGVEKLHKIGARPLIWGWAGADEVVIPPFRRWLEKTPIDTWGAMECAAPEYLLTCNEVYRPKGIRSSALIAGFLSDGPGILTIDYTGWNVPGNERFKFLGVQSSAASDSWRYGIENFSDSNDSDHLARMMKIIVDRKTGIGPPVFLWKITLKDGVERLPDP